jgi:hypothetical protein
LRRSLSIIGGLVLATLVSQFPEYAQQYEQRLGGAVDELRVIVNEFEMSATNFGLTREQALARYAATGDDFIRGRGTTMAQIIARYEMLSATLGEIQGATGWERFAHLPRYLDTDIGARALENFRPAVPVTVEGAAYAIAGFMFGYLIVSGLVRFLLLPFRRRAARAG